MSASGIQGLILGGLARMPAAWRGAVVPADDLAGAERSAARPPAGPVVGRDSLPSFRA